jgi:glycosyltransferase involved in cell wall biosynthesis
MAGPLFRELAEDISTQWSPSLLITGHPDTLKCAQSGSLKLVAACEYERRSHAARTLSWIRYFVCVLFRSWRMSGTALLFLVSNPPFLGLVGYIFKRLRRQHYVVLVYDIHPDALVRFGVLKESGWTARLWRKLNRLVWQNADVVFTIGDRMGKELERKFDASKTRAGKVVVVPNWASTDWIRPLAKNRNEFAQKYGQVGKLTVMYSGNLGQTHDIETILAAAKELREHESIRFMIIGDGAKKHIVEEAKRRDELDNLTVLPFQPEHVLPYSLPTADVAVVTLAKGVEGLSVPSKTFYYMAAGSALSGLCDGRSEVAQVISRHDCGFWVRPGDTDAMVSRILELCSDRAKLSRYCANSRLAAETFYSRTNTHYYLETLDAVCR